MQEKFGRHRWLGLAVGLLIIMGAATLLGSNHASAQQPPDHSQVQADLDAARLNWAATGIDSYEITYYTSCFCPFPFPRVTVVVDDGVILSATSSDGATVAFPRTVPSMFDEIQEKLDIPAAVASATFDASTGQPEIFGFDVSLMIADEEYSVVIEEFTPAEDVNVQATVDNTCDSFLGGPLPSGTIVVTTENLGNTAVTVDIALGDMAETVVIAAGDSHVITSAGLGDAAYQAEVMVTSPVETFVFFDLLPVNCVAYAQIQAEIDAARAKWDALGTANQNYTMTYTTSCFCPPASPTVVEVVDGVIVNDPPDPFNREPLTVEALFTLIQEGLDQPVDGMTASFNAVSGYPESASFDRILLAADDEIGYTVTDLVFTQVCCDPTPEITVEVSCVAGNGRLDISFVSTAIVDGPVEHELRIGQLAPRFHTALSGETVTDVTTGRPEGPITVALYVDGGFVSDTTVTVDCDPPRPEVEVEVSCLAENGRFDIYLSVPPQRLQQPLPPPPFAQYVVHLEAANHPALSPRQLNLPEGGEGRIVYTGRPDDSFVVRVEKNGSAIFEDSFVVDCDVFDEPITLTQSCLAGNGRLDVDMFNSDDIAVNYVIQVSGLADRSVLVGAGAASRMTYTGRPEGPITVTVLRDGVRAFQRTVAVSCDPVCDEGYAPAGAACETPNGCVAPQIELESVGGVAMVDPITGEITSVISYSCVATCDAPAERINPGLCRIFLP